MNSACFFLASFMAVLTVPSAETPVIHRFVVQPSSTLTIDGATNVNKFNCSIATYNGTDTLIMKQQKKGERPFFSRGVVRLAASDFKCRIPAITSDFRKVIKVEEYPTVTIEFISFERLPRYQPKEERFKSKINITLANVMRPFDVTCALSKDEKGFIHLKGGREFSFSDFNLETPTRMMGMVKVKETIDVNFHLVLLRPPQDLPR